MINPIDLFFSLPFWSRWLLSGLTTFIITLIGLAGRNYLNASKEFKRIIHTELKGIIPDIVVYIEPGKIKDQITASIIPIKTGGEIFKHSLPFFCIGPFSRALAHYCDTARTIDWNEQQAYQLYPEMAKPSYVSPKDKLNWAVKQLLKYAK